MASISRLPGLLGLWLLAPLAAVPALAMAPIEARVAATLDGAPPEGTLRLDSFPLDDGTAVALELERFEVWPAGAVVVAHGEDGEQFLAPPTTRYFRGRVAGDPQSWVFLARDESLRGFVATGGRLFAVAPSDDAYRETRPGAESLVRQIDRELDSPLDRPLFRCENEGLDLFPPDGVPAAVAHEGLVVRAMSNGKSYQATVAIETDYELYQRLGSTSAVSAYVSDLVAAASSIYYRDVQTSLKLGNVYIYSTASDPWTATNTVDALYEIGDYWHANRPKTSVPRTTVHFLSRKNMGGGVSWLGVLCREDFYQGGHWGGAYGVSASLNGQFSTTNPNLYWDILCFTHELGHNFDAEHTECYDPPADTCTPCSSFSCTGPVPSGGGTIMSYCHACSGGYSNITLYFGFPGQASQVVLDDMRAHIESRATSVPSCLPELLQLTVSRNGTGSGTVTSSPAGISCGSSCSALIAKGTQVTLTAAAADGSTFAGWSGACSGIGSCVVTVNTAQSVTATFNVAASYTLTVSRSGAGSGTVSSSPAGISCGTDCSESYAGNTVVTLTAAPAAGSAFAGWSGACAGSGPCVATMSAARSVTATFSDVSSCTTVLASQTVTTPQTIEDCHSIYAGPSLTVASPGHLTLRAAVQVVLRSGTSVGSSARLTVALDSSLAGT